MPYVSATSGGIAGAPATTDTLTYPGSIGASDYVVCLIMYRNSTTVSTTLTPPTGFTNMTGAVLATPAATGAMSLWGGFRTGTGGGTGITFSATALDSWAILRFSGTDLGQPNLITWGTSGASTTTTTINGKTGSTTLPNTTVVNVYGARVNNTAGVTVSFTPPGSTTEVADFARPTGGTTNIVGMEVVVETQAASGAITQRNTTAVPSTGGTAFYPLSAVFAVADTAVAQLPELVMARRRY